MLTEKDHIEPLTLAILNAIRDYAESNDEQIMIAPMAISALSANIVAFINSETAWNDAIKADIVSKIGASILEGITAKQEQ